MKVHPTDHALTLRVTLLYVTPPVWRDILVRASTPLSEVHSIIQACMGWEDRHLYEFRHGGQNYALRDEGNEVYPGVEEVRLNDLGITRGSVIDYTYDFGDGWDHRIEVFSEHEITSTQKYPECLRGEGACPPEDCGGPPGYEELQAAIKDPSREGSAELLDGLGLSRPECFTVERANHRLSRRGGAS